jgi:hypothetical protein
MPLSQQTTQADDPSTKSKAVEPSTDKAKKNLKKKKKK